MHDPFTGKPTRISGRHLPSESDRAAIQDDHERRLAALARLSACAAECGVAADPDRDIVTLPEDDVSLLELGDPRWARLGAAIRSWRELVPLRNLADFGFSDELSSGLQEGNSRLHYLHSGVEASAFISLGDNSIYKFYRPVEEKRTGSSFAFRSEDEHLLSAEAHPGNYRDLFEKLMLIDALGMATEVVAVTPEGTVVAKQTLGDRLPQDAEMSDHLPSGLIEIPSRFLRANRDHPRLYFLRGRAFLVADLHARNFVRSSTGELFIIDLVAAPWPAVARSRENIIANWLERVRTNPAASALPSGGDDEL